MYSFNTLHYVAVWAAVTQPLLTPAGIARLSDAGGDVLFASNMQARNPTEAHSYLERYLYDNYQFRNAPDVHSFLALLTGATSSIYASAH